MDLARDGPSVRRGHGPCPNRKFSARFGRSRTYVDCGRGRALAETLFRWIVPVSTYGTDRAFAPEIGNSLRGARTCAERVLLHRRA